MITVTRLNGKPIIVNADQIRSIEENPDSTIALMNGDRIIVQENMTEIVSRVVEYGRSLRKLVVPS
ncbi:MAG: flagellar FlbD family protein [Phycisphaerales bacterium]|nr:flagellar FlbD family protein [Phycisphaerales bacterium]